jgi:hypothetical protein
MKSGDNQNYTHLLLLFDNCMTSENYLPAMVRLFFLLTTLSLGGCSRLTGEAPVPPPAARPTEPPHIPEIETPNPWFWLQRYQRSITRATFQQQLHNLFDPFDGLSPYLTVTDESVAIYPTPARREPPQFRLFFAPDDSARQHWPRPYRTPTEFRALAKPADRPLQGLRIAIDPGHIGGAWAQIENRSVNYPGLGLIQEGDLNIITAHYLRGLLTSLGAEVFLTREASEPTTTRRPEEFYDEAIDFLFTSSPRLKKRYGDLPRDQQIEKLGERMLDIAGPTLWKRDEIKERGYKIKNHFQPDLTVTLYINATPRSGGGRLTPGNRLIFFVHGSYTKTEVQDPHAQLRLFYKLLDQASPIEAEVAAHIADVFRVNTGLPAVLYQDSPTTRSVIPNNPYVVARNIACNREYDGPVVTTEPFFMNNRLMAQRFLAGDFEGTRTISGKAYASIFREYAQWVADGLVAAYGPAPAPPAPSEATSATIISPDKKSGI